MSSYIRTKDRIYETWENGETCNGFGCKFNYGTIKIHKKDVIKQADTIEELCDMFVTLEKLDGRVWHSLNFTLCDDLRKDRDNDGVYGAIWTSKGLIYVAKLVDGELVLI